MTASATARASRLCRGHRLSLSHPPSACTLVTGGRNRTVRTGAHKGRKADSGPPAGWSASFDSEWTCQMAPIWPRWHRIIAKRETVSPRAPLKLFQRIICVSDKNGPCDMPTIRTIVDEETYASLSRKRRQAGLPSVSALFLSRCDELTDLHEADEIVRRAIRLASRRRPGEEFRLQDLFPLTRWKQFSKGARLRSGRMFKAEVDAARRGIRAVRRSSSNHQFYARSEAVG